jgi:hypothetical protein
MLNKNEKARLKRINGRLDKVIDNLHQAHGECWPKSLRGIGEQIASALNSVRTASDTANTLLADPVADEGQMDIEDAIEPASLQQAIDEGDADERPQAGRYGA